MAQPNNSEIGIANAKHGEIPFATWDTAASSRGIDHTRGHGTAGEQYRWQWPW